jgi:hypothetical protein
VTTTAPGPWSTRAAAGARLCVLLSVLADVLYLNTSDANMYSLLVLELILFVVYKKITLCMYVYMYENM